MAESDSETERARRLFSGPCDFVTGVASLSSLPPSDLPEIAFAGRSNVGKSSLINALTERKTLARTSNTPGRTQQLNFFNLGGLFYLVDMPGYGYAKVSKSQKKQWDRLIRDYLRGRPALRCVFVLVDARHGLKDSDREMMKLLDEAAVPYRIILTKTDKVKTQDLAALEDNITSELKKHAAAFPEVLATSAIEKTAIDELRTLAMNVAMV